LRSLSYRSRHLVKVPELETVVLANLSTAQDLGDVLGDTRRLERPQMAIDGKYVAVVKVGVTDSFRRPRSIPMSYQKRDGLPFLKAVFMSLGLWVFGLGEALFHLGLALSSICIELHCVSRRRFY